MMAKLVRSASCPNIQTHLPSIAPASAPERLYGNVQAENKSPQTMKAVKIMVSVGYRALQKAMATHSNRVLKASRRRTRSALPITYPATAGPPPQDLDRVFDHIERMRYERRTRHYQRQLGKCFVNRQPWDDGQTIARARIDDQGFRRRHVTAIANRVFGESRAEGDVSLPMQTSFGTSTFVNGALEDPFGPLLSETAQEDTTPPEVLESYKVSQDMRRRIELERYQGSCNGT
ncbi:hypothetical protein HBI56_161140 [Parastagonospora nodorum]|nr:hypothetical protein HBH56_211570 [Parastagonospora nodorum]KAH3931356.1 hypothetical protein HBH54_100180 [Parastagonospora nodorum]KAH3944444.1 hypothetical protein HBH53_161650 [Parastagonospora nodorum]KAH3962771.1 hypothetical protein HBH52_222520 [Parastagonospora nodorum]KAH3994508.1 hypothetical protein HBI10_185890 [Parastagonospora nodorum]